MGDSSGGRDNRDREWERERERERLMLSDGKDSHSVYSPAPLSPMRSEEFDYQQSNITLLKAQLKLVTHERDMLKKDVKRISQERDGAYRHMSLSASPQSSLETSSHHRTNSDTAPTIAKSGAVSTLSRSHSIASAGDKSLVMSSGRSMDIDKNPDRLMHELQIAKKQHSDSLKKVDQAMKDVDYYRQEAENLRSRYNDVILEKQRLDQEVVSLRRFLEEDRKEMAEMRRQHQEILNVEGGPSESMSIMYGTLLRKYETVKDDYGLISKRYDDLVASHSAAVAKLEHSQEEIVRYKKQYEDMLTERNKFKQQCTQAIRQWDQALRERNDYRDMLAKVQRQHEEAVKEINQAMVKGIKASKDIKRLTEERNAAMQEYSMIMSERDSVHKEIEKLQDEVSNTNSKMKEVETRTKVHDEEKRKLVCQIELLRREIDAALLDRDKAIKEAHELREKLGEREKSTTGKSTLDFDSRKDLRQSKLDVDKHNKERDSVSSEHLAMLASKDGSDRTKVENLDQAMAEIERLRKDGEKLQGELTDASLEADVAKGRRDWAFSERDKVVLERESIRTLCDKLRRERDRAVSELAEALRDLDEVKKNRNELSKENKDLRERIESVEKETRMRMLQRSVGHSHSRDSAIDTDLQDWETETIDVDMGRISNDDDLGLDLAGGRDDPVCPGENPVYIASINKGSIVEGKLKVNDCILRVNNIDCRDVDRSTILSTLRGAGSTVSLVVRRRRAGRRYQAILHLGGRADHGITLDSGIYISRISPGSVSARESVIAVGDRVLTINEANMDHVRSVQDATALLNQAHDVLSITLQKNSTSYGPLSSSSSGHCMMEDDKLCSPKTFSAATSPIKETIRHGSRELVKKLISRDVQTEKYAGGFNSSSSSEKVYNVTKAGSRESKSPWGQFTETVKEKLETVRGRRYSKEQGERDRHDTSDTSRRSESGHYSDSGRRFGSSRGESSHSREHEPKPLDQDKEDALAELDSVLNSYHIGANGKGNGSSKKKRKDRDSFKNGGTWPRARGGPVIEHSTGTILHPHKYKERLPLSELLSNVPKYPIEQADSRLEDIKQEPAPVIYREDQRARYSRNKYRDHRATTYDLVSSYAERQDLVVGNQSYHLLAQSISRDSSLGDRLKSISRDGSEDRKGGYMSALTPSDTSIDDSVKSGNVGKDVLLKYLKQKPSRLATSDSDHTSPIEQLSPPLPMQTQSLYKADLPKSTAEYYHHLHATSLTRPTPSGFSPYFPAHQHPPTPASMALHQIMSSPRYSSPPPLLPPTVSGESILGSPIPRPYEDHSRLYPPLEPPQSLSSISPTSGLYHHSPSPSLEMFGGKPRLVQHHSSHLHHPSHSYHPPAPYGSASVASNVFPASSSGLIGHNHGSNSGLPHQLGYTYKLPDEVLSPPTYPDYGTDPRSLRYNQEHGRVQRISSPYGRDSKSKTLPSSSHSRSEKSSMSQKSCQRSNFGTFPRKKKDRTASRNSPQGGTLPGRRSKGKDRKIKDSGSSGADRDRSSGSRKSDSRKSGDRIARKPSKELLKIQNFSDSSDDDFRLSSKRDILGKRRGSKVSDSRSFHEQLHLQDKKDERVMTEGTSSKTDQASSLSPTSSRKSPNISRQSPKANQSPKRTSKKNRQSPENQRKKTSTAAPTTKSLNMQIKEFIKSSSPPKTRKVSETSLSKFDAFNHTSSHKLSHAISKEFEKPPSSKQNSTQYTGQYNESYDEYEYSYHPRRSSKEVLDFTSSRKSTRDNLNKCEEKELGRRKYCKEDKGHKSDGSEGHHKRKDTDHRHCQCLSPRKENNPITEALSPSHTREDKEVFDFTSKKLTQPPAGSLKSRKHRSKENKVDITRKDVEIHSSSSLKSPRRKEERNVFDFSVRDGSEYATLRKKKSSRREVLDFTSGSERREVLDFTSSSDRREVLDFTSSSRLDNSSINTSQEIINLKSSSEFIVSKSNSREVIHKEKLEQKRQNSDAKDRVEPWPESCHIPLPRQKSDLENSSREGFDSSRGGGDGLSSANSKEDLDDDKINPVFSPLPPRETIDPPDLFNTNKINLNCSIDQNKEDKNLDVHFAPDLVEERYSKDLDICRVKQSEEELSVNCSSLTRKNRYLGF